jgi:hypothetical protein
MNVGSFLQTLLLVVLFMAAGRFVRENPLLFGWKALASMPFTTSSGIPPTTNGSSSLSSSSSATDLVLDTISSASPATTIIITSHPVLDAVLKHHEADFVGVAGDYDAYRNHW